MDRTDETIVEVATMGKQLFYLRNIRYRYPASIREKATALIENDKGDGPRTTYAAADFFNGAPCATTIRRWVLEKRFRREAISGVGGEV